MTPEELAKAPDPDAELATVDEVAAWLRVSRSWLYARVAEDAIPAPGHPRPPPVPHADAPRLDTQRAAVHRHRRPVQAERHVSAATRYICARKGGRPWPTSVRT